SPLSLHDALPILVSVGLVHVEPFGGYSRKVKSVAELPQGATIAIPNDPSNSGRALLLLQKQGLIKLKDPSNIVATPLDVVENPKQLKFRELEAAMLPRALDDVALALINTNYALEAGLVPTKDALFIEGADSPYANLVAARPDNKDAPAIKKLVDALHARGESVHPGQVQGRCRTGVLSVVWYRRRPHAGRPPRSGGAFALEGDAMHHPPEAVVVIYRVVLRTAVIPERDGVGCPGKAAG